MNLFVGGETVHLLQFKLIVTARNKKDNINEIKHVKNKSYIYIYAKKTPFFHAG